MHTANLISPVRTVLLSTIVGIAALTAACGSDSGATGPTPNPGGNDPDPVGVAGFEVTNSSDRDAYYLYTRACGASEWGADELGSANILYPGESVTVDESAGCYDVLALTKHATPRYQALYQAKTVSAGQVTPVSVQAADWSQISDPSIASLAVGRK